MSENSKEAYSADFAGEALRQGEMRVQAQLDLVISADQRSMALLGATVAGMISLIGFGASAFGDKEPNIPLGVALFCAVIPLGIAVMAAIKATRPGEFHSPGKKLKDMRKAAVSPIAETKLATRRRL